MPIDETTEDGGFKLFLWNPRTREFLGRTASRWGLIILFYVVFYAFLGAMFFLTMYVMLLTIDEYHPTYQDRLPIPGMMIWPRGAGLEIEYDLQQTESWDIYVRSLDNFLSEYDESRQAKINVECPPDQYFIQEDSGDVRNVPKRACQFNRTALLACSGISDQNFGYDEGSPCVLVKLNRIIGLIPSKNGIAPYITCGAKKYKVGKDEWADDAHLLGELAYFPPNGTLNLMYFPYYGKRAQQHYSQPLVAVKFLNITLNADVNIECRINAENIEANPNTKDKFAGRVAFRLRINSGD